MADWVWFYGIRPPQETVKGLRKVESRWLDHERPLEPGQREAELDALTRPMSTYWNPIPHPLFSHAWWTVYDTRRGAWGPWTRHRPREVSGCGDVGELEDILGPPATVAVLAGLVYWFWLNWNDPGTE